MSNFNFMIMEKISKENYENFAEFVNEIKKQAEYMTYLASELVGTSFHGDVLISAAKTLSLYISLLDVCSHIAKFVEE